MASNARNRQGLAREAKTIERLDHPNIVKIWDYSGDKQEQCYIVTELVEGLNLRQVMEEQIEIPSEVIALIGMELCSALQYAHSLGFIHRDIKPENIMIRNDGSVKLLDFGIARFAEDEGLTMTKSLVGSPAYMSPEQAMDEQEQILDHRSDLFSLGIVLFELVSDELPYHGSNPSVILKNIIDNRRTQAHCITPQVSLMLSDCIESLLQTNRDLRLPEAQTVLLSLRKVWDEAELNPDEEEWSLRYWLSDPASYKNRLQEHLRTVLLERGRRLMLQGEMLQAQRYLNRLLILDPENDEVFDLLQNMHTVADDHTTKSQPSLWIYAIPVLLVGIGVWVFRPNPQDLAIVSVDVIDPPNETEMVVELNEPKQAAVIKLSAPQKIRSESIDPSIIRPKLSLKADPTTTVGNVPDMNSGTLTISIPNSWAEIWIDDVQYGRTGQVAPLSLEAGTHKLRLENPYSIPHEQTIEIQEDERTHIEVRALKRKPATLIFANSHSPECEVSLDDSDVGELGVLQFQLAIQSPNLPHELKLACPDETLETVIGRLTPGSSMPVRF